MLTFIPSASLGYYPTPDLGTEDAIMKHILLTVRGIPIDYQIANAIARAVAQELEESPTLVAWHDAPEGRMSPVIEGADIQNRWEDYGVSHGGDFAVSVNGDFDFIFADTSRYETLSHSPYIELRDSQGRAYLCLAEHLRDPGNPNQEACFAVDVANPVGGGMHEG